MCSTITIDLMSIKNGMHSLLMLGQNLQANSEFAQKTEKKKKKKKKTALDLICVNR